MAAAQAFRQLKKPLGQPGVLGRHGHAEEAVLGDAEEQGFAIVGDTGDDDTFFFEAFTRRVADARGEAVAGAEVPDAQFSIVGDGDEALVIRAERDHGHK